MGETEQHSILALAELRPFYTGAGEMSKLGLISSLRPAG